GWTTVEPTDAAEAAKNGAYALRPRPTSSTRWPAAACPSLRSQAASGARTDQPVSVRDGCRWLPPGHVRSSSDTRPTLASAAVSAGRKPSLYWPGMTSDLLASPDREGIAADQATRPRVLLVGRT